MTQQLPSHSAPVEDLSPFSRVQLIAVDIDGTLASRPKDQVAGITRRLQGTLHHYGVRTTVATGRAYSGAKPIVNGLGVASSPIIIYNGAVIIAPRGKCVLRRSVVHLGAVETIIQIASSGKATTWVYNCADPELALGAADGIGVEETVSAWGPVIGPSKEFNGVEVQWQAATAKPRSGAVAVLVLATSADSRGELAKSLNDVEGIAVTSSGAGFIECRPAGVSKASALAVMAASMGIPSEHVLTVGDNDNDEEMLRWAGIGVAVRDATPRALSAARYSSSRPAAEGVIEVLRIVAHSKRYYPSSANSGF
jgi:Cof subfamily protein (haloacid dehalogenase superfamily)